MITLDDYISTHGKHRERGRWVSPAVEENAEALVSRINAMFLVWGFSRRLSGGFRDVDTNRKLRNASPYSRHITGQAADIEDHDGSLKAWALKHQDAIANVGLWCEPLHMTPTWLHVQTTPVPSGLRVSP